MSLSIPLRTLLTFAIAVPLFAQTRTIRIFTQHPFEADEMTILNAAAPGVRVEFVTEAQRREADVLFGEPTGAVLDAMPKLRWVQVGGAGMEWMDDAFRKSPVVTTNMQRIFAPGITETAMGLLLCLTRGISINYMPQFYKHEWKPVGTPKSDDQIELVGKTMGIVGMGGIGSALARRAHNGFDMHVIATDAKPIPKPEYVDELHDPSYFPEMAKRVDVLVLAAPLVKETRGMMTEAIFRSMKKHSYFLALSRGPLYDDMALVKALKEGWIAGAGLDVFPIEPVPANHPIFDLPNVVMTPHTSGWSPDRQKRLVAHFAENIRRYSMGLPLVGVVDKAAGY